MTSFLFDLFNISCALLFKSWNFLTSLNLSLFTTFFVFERFNADVLELLTLSGVLLFWTKFLSVFAKSTLPDGFVPVAPDEKLTVLEVLLIFLLILYLDRH